MTNILRLAASTLVLLATVIHGIQAADPYNPKPCKDPYTCKEAPVITASPSGPSDLCQGQSGTWAVNGYISDGKKQKCDETPVTVTPSGIVWGYVVTGPDGSVQTSGGSNSFTWTPALTGAHTITWTGYSSGAEPCQVGPVTKTQTFNVEGPKCSCTISSVTACPGEIARLPWTITNPSATCTFTYYWTAYVGDGSPTVTPTIKTGSVSVGPNQTVDGVVEFDVASDSPLGTKAVRFEVAAGSSQNACNSASQITVDVLWQILPPLELSLCPKEAKKSFFILDNMDDHCDVVVNWDVVKVGGEASVLIAPAFGIEAIPAGDALPVDFEASAVPASKGGDAIFRITASSNYGQTKTEEFKVSVVKIKEVTHDAKPYAEWKPGFSVKVTVTAEGNPSTPQITYELYDVELKAVVWSKTSNNLTEIIPVENPGRYRVRVKACQDERLVQAKDPFVAWKITVDPTSLVFDWDVVKGEISAEKWKEISRLSGLAEDLLEEVTGGLAEKLKSETDGFTNDANKIIKTTEDAMRGLGTLIAEKEQEKTAASDEKKALEKESGEQDRLKKRLEGDISKSEDLLAKKEAEIADIKQRLQGTISNAERERLTKALAQAETVADRYRTSVKLYKESLEAAKQRLAQIADKIKVLKDKLDELGKILLDLGAKLKVLKAAHTAMASALAAKLMKNVGRAAVGLQAALAIMDIKEGIEGITAYQVTIIEIEEKTKLSEFLEKQHKAAIDAFINSRAKRERPPLMKPIKVTGTPGSLPLKFTEKPDVWRTRDDDIPQSEVAWGYRHLVLLGGDEKNWDKSITTKAGVTTTYTPRVHAYGNLGSSTIRLFVADEEANQSISARSDGLDEETALELVNTRIRTAKEASEKRKAAWGVFLDTLKVIGGAITLGGLAYAVAGIISFTLAATIGAVVAVIVLGVTALVLFLNWLFEPEDPLRASIVELFPSRETL